MLKNENIKILCTNKTKSYYLDKGYLSDNGYFIINIKDLPEKSHQKIDVICDICGKEKVINYSSYIQNISVYNIYSCSTKCAIFKNKITNLEKYGYDNPVKSDIIKNKIKKSNIEKYGCDNVFKSDVIKEKIKNSNKEKYGYEYFSQSEIGKEKIKNSFEVLYKDNHPLRDVNIKEKIKHTNLLRYGYDNPTKSKIVKDKIIKTNKERCGEKSNLIIYNRNKKNIYFEYIKKELYPIYDVINYKDGLLTIKHKICDKEFHIKRNNLYDRNINNIEICLNCNPLNTLDSSKEKELNEYIKSLNIDYIENDRIILDGKELDIYIPSKNLAIEFNGLYWHSESYKDKNYHLDKSNSCSIQGINLIHIWEDEWVFKQDIVKSIILNRLDMINQKIYARQCDVRIVNDSRLVREFLDNNHIQGYSQSSIKLGLYYNNELVSLMTFGYRHTNSKKEFELIRFCNLKYVNVIGAASKLFKFFKQNYSFTELISYSDFRMFDGSLYQTLGFTKQHLSKPDYFWCKDLERKHRFNFNKQKLIAEGYESDKTEVEIMHSRGYYRVYGCGQYKWLYKNII